MQDLICFIAFLYHYIDSSVFLEVARKGATASPPPKTNTGYIQGFKVVLEAKIIFWAYLFVV